MSNERARVFAIFGVVAVLAGGAGVYFIKVYRPKQVRADAQAEIAEWETRWKAARDCLLGPSPASSKTAEALTVREMSADPLAQVSGKSSCTALMAKLVRGDSEQQSGLEDVEIAWNELETAAAKAAQAFAMHVSAGAAKDDPLPAALDALEAARAKLRAAAEMPAADASGKPLPAALIVALADGSDPVTDLHIEMLPSAHGVVAFGKTSSRMVQVTLAAGAAPKVARLGPGSMRAVGDGTWGASQTEGGLRVGAMDVEGAMAQPAELKLAGAQLIAATGSAADGLVVAGNAKQLIVAHYANGVLTQDPPVAITSANGTVDADGSVAVLFDTPDHSTHVRSWRAGKAADELPGGGLAVPLCLSKDHVYTGGPSVAELIGCAPEGAIERAGGEPQRFLACLVPDTCGPHSLPRGAPSFATTALAGGKLYAIVERSGVLAVWREGGGATFYSLAEPLQPIQLNAWPLVASTDGQVIDIVAHGAKGYAVIRVPI